MSSDGPIQFYDMKLRQKVWVPREDCFTEVMVTKTGKKKRIVAVVRDNPRDPTDVRHLSKLCRMDFEL